MNTAKCFLAFCKNKGKIPGISYFQFTDNRYNAWMEALGLDPEVIKYSNSNRICSAHFTESDIKITPRGTMILKRGALPRLNLGPNVEQRKYLLLQKRALAESHTEQEGVPVQTVEVHKDLLGCQNVYILFEDEKTKDGQLHMKQENMEQNETRHNDFLSEQGILVKTEVKEELVDPKNLHVVFVDGKIKQEELDIKEENMEQNEIRRNDFLPEQEGILVKTEVKEELIDCKNLFDTEFADGKIKEEELHIKDEIMEQNETRQENEASKGKTINQRSGGRKPLKKRIFQCDKCAFQTEYKKTMKNHRIRHKKPEEVKLYKCDHCDYQTVHKDYLSVHTRRHQEKIDTFKCDKCNYQTTVERLLDKHKRRHNNPQFKCDQCDYQTISKRAFKIHRFQHNRSNEVDTFKCAQCSYQAVDERSLNEHLCQNQSSKKVMLKCHYCNHRTSLKANLTNHMLRHKNPEEVTMYKCEHCAYQTIHKRVLQRHLLRHKTREAADMFKCDQCSFETVWKNALKMHRRVKHNSP